jgi:hypothetical protein
MKLSEMIRVAAGTMNAEDLKKALEQAIKKHFPKSMVWGGVTKKGIGGPDITLNFTVAADKSQLANGIVHNDLSYTIFRVEGINEDGSVNDQVDLEPILGGSFFTKPTESHMALGKIKVRFAKKKGTPEQIVKHVDSYFAKLHQAINANLDKIPDSYLSRIKNNL